MDQGVREDESERLDPVPVAELDLGAGRECLDPREQTDSECLTSGDSDV